MLKPNINVAPYSQKDFQKANRLGKIRHYILEPDKFELDQDDLEYYGKLHQAFLLTFEEIRQSSAVKIIQESVAGAESWQMANKILRDMYQVYSPIMEKNRAFRRAVMVEKLHIMAEVATSKAMFDYTDENDVVHKCADKEWMEIARKLLADAAKLEGLDKHEEAALDPDAIQLPQIIVTSNPAAYLASQRAEDAQYADDSDD